MPQCTECRTDWSAHSITTRDGKHENLCCRCYVNRGFAPADWHPICMNEYRKLEDKQMACDPSPKVAAARDIGKKFGANKRDYMPDIEYKVIAGSAADCQKWLNQWRHQYKLTIIEMSADKDGTTILLTREALQQNNPADGVPHAVLEGQEYIIDYSAQDLVVLTRRR